MSKIDVAKYNAQVANASSQVKISSTVFKNFIADVKDVVDQNSPDGQYAADAGSTDDYAVTLAPVPTAYFIGMVVRFKANTANTGACTLNVNSLGAKTIKKNTTDDLGDNNIVANQIITVVYDGTNFQLIGASQNELKSHLADTAPHSATSAATASRLMLRDADGRSKVANPFNQGDALNLSEIFTSPFTTLNAATSVTALSTGEQYWLVTLTPSGTNVATNGVYYIVRQGTAAAVNTILADASLTITVDGTFHVVATNSSGASRSIQCHLIRL